MAKASGSGAPATVAEGLGNVLRAVTDTMAAPDAAQMKVPLMHLQATVLDLVHGQMNKGQQQPGQAGAQPPGAAAAPPPPPGGGGGAGLAGGLSGLMGQSQGPSNATSGGGPSLSGMDPEQMRQMALVGADGGDQ
jgi:hypothetical protein